MEKKGYQDLHVWRESILYATEVYGVMQGFPAHERFALCDLIRRAVVSVAAHIAEGQSLPTRREFLHHLWIARGRLAGRHTLLVLSEQLGYVSPGQLLALEKGLQAVSRPLEGLIAALEDSGS